MIAFGALHLAGAAEPPPPYETCEEALAEVHRENIELRSRLGEDRDLGFGLPVRVDMGERTSHVVAFGRDIRVDGEVVGDAVSIGGDVLVGPSGAVGGAAVALGGRVRLAPGARVAASAVHAGPAVVEVDSSTWLGRMSAPSLVPSELAWDAVRTMVRRGVWMLMAAGAGLLVLGTFPQRVRRVARDLEDRPVRAAVVGTVASGSLLTFSALFTVVTLGFGSPVAAALLGLLATAWLLGFAGLCEAIGSRLPIVGAMSARWAGFLIGVAVVTVLVSLPWIGTAALAGASVLGVGSALASGFGSPRWDA